MNMIVECRRSGCFNKFNKTNQGQWYCSKCANEIQTHIYKQKSEGWGKIPNGRNDNKDGLTKQSNSASEF